MGAPLLKEIILLTVKVEAGQVIQDITSGAGVKNALKHGAKIDSHEIKAVTSCSTHKTDQQETDG